MISFSLPNDKTYNITYLVLDYNGTLALDGIPYDCVYPLLKKLSENLKIYILTADTFGNVYNFKDKLSGEIKILKETPISNAKKKFIMELGAKNVISIGNGKNDEMMLKTAELGIALIQNEGICTDTLLKADIVFKSICDALDCILHPKRLIASLRK